MDFCVQKLLELAFFEIVLLALLAPCEFFLNIDFKRVTWLNFTFLRLFAHYVEALYDNNSTEMKAERQYHISCSAQIL